MCIFLMIWWENFDELKVCDEISDGGVDKSCSYDHQVWVSMGEDLLLWNFMLV